LSRVSGLLDAWQRRQPQRRPRKLRRDEHALSQRREAPESGAEILLCRKHTPDWRRLTSADVGLNAKLPFQISVASGGFEFQKVGDIATFWQIFYRGIYSLESSDRLIVDAGANIGAFSLYVLQNAPNADVVASEPAPDSCHRIRIDAANSKPTTMNRGALTAEDQIGETALCGP
jgi:hypothetical protein